MSILPWTMVAMDLKGNPIGAIKQAKGRVFDFPLNNATTGSFQVRLDHPLLDLFADGDCMVKVYEGTNLRENYDIASVQEVGEGSDSDGAVVALAGGLLRLGAGSDQPGRLIGKSTLGFTYTGDVGQAMGSMINTANLESETGIRVGTIVNSSSNTVGPYYYKPIGEGIAEISATLDGPDFQLVPLEPLTNGGKFWEFQAAPYLGLADNSGVIFEYAMGRRNVKRYERPVDRKGMLNRAYGLPPNFPSNTCDPSPGTVQSAQDLASIAARGLRESVVVSDINSDPLRLFLCQEHVRVRATPRKLIIFDSVVPDGTGRVPMFKRDFDVGDVIRGRAVNPLTGEIRFDALVRVYGATVSLDDNGTPTPSMRLVPSA